MPCLLYALLWHGFMTCIAVFIPTTNYTDGPNAEPNNTDLAWNTTDSILMVNSSLDLQSDFNYSLNANSTHQYLNLTESKIGLNLQYVKHELSEKHSTFDPQVSKNSSADITGIYGTNVSRSGGIGNNNTTENTTDFINQTDSRTSGFLGNIISRILNSSYWMNNSTYLPLGNNSSDFMPILNKSDEFIWKNPITSTESPITNTPGSTGIHDINETVTDNLQVIREFNASYPSAGGANISQIAGSWVSLNYSTGTPPLLKTFNDTSVSFMEDKFSIPKDSPFDKTNNSVLNQTAVGKNVNISVSPPTFLDTSKNRTVVPGSTVPGSVKNSVHWDKSTYVTEAAHIKTKLSSALNIDVTEAESTGSTQQPTASANSIKNPLVVTLNPVIKHHYSGVVKGILLEGFKHGSWDNQGPVDDDPFGSLIWRDRKYLISVLVPIGVGITGAVVIVIVAYVVRSYKRKLKRRAFTSPSRIFRPQAQLAIMDDVLLLDDSSDDGF